MAGISSLRRAVGGTLTKTPFDWKLGDPELVNTVLPTISGTMQPGQVVTAVSGTWTTAGGHTVSTVRYRWRQYNGTTEINSTEGATYTIAAAGATPTLVLFQDVIDTLTRQDTAASQAYTITVTSLAPIFTNNPFLAGTGRVGTPVNMTNATATGTPAPTITRAYYLNGTVLSGQTGASYIPVEADIGDALTGRNGAANGVLPNATSNFTNTITIIPATGDFVTVTNKADLQIELNSAVQGRIIECDENDYAGTVVATAGAKTFGQRVTIVARDRLNPPVFTQGAFNLSGWSGLIFDGLSFLNTSVDAQGDQNGKINLINCSNFKFLDCLFRRQHESIRADNSTNWEVAYCTFEEQGMEGIGRFYAGQTNLWVHHCKVWKTDINLARVSESDRHCDGQQFAVNGLDTPPNGVLIEDCYIETLQGPQTSMHGFGFFNNACRPAPNGSGRTLAQSGYRDLSVKRCYIHTAHPQGVAFEGVTNGLVDTCLLRASTGATANNQKPTVYLLGDKFVNIDIVNTVLPAGRTVSMIDVSASQGQISIQVTNSDTAVPAGWAATDVALGRVGQYAPRGTPTIPPGTAPSLNFSLASNSQYIPIIF